MAAKLRTLEEIRAAARDHYRDMGWRPTPTQAAKLAALLRPHLDRPQDTGKTA